MRRLWIITLVVSALAAPEPAAAETTFGDYLKAARLLKQWRFEDAKQAIAELIDSNPKAKETRYLQGEIAFLGGDYVGALQHLEDLDDEDVFGNVGQLRALVESTIDATDGFARYESPSGRFVVFYPPGKDEVIVELTAEVLDTAYEVIGEDLGYEPPEQIRVEILARPQDLARVSTLTESEIETTGTIALCKYGKLMVVTPRATVFGYKWMDTMVHEYVHYVVSRASHDNVPVWLHEGLARFEQTRWREEPGTRLNAIEENLLATALKNRRLISFDDMHPSMAKLPSAQAAALAFSEVYTMIGYIHAEKGYEGIREIIQIQKQGKSAKRAVAEVMGDRFSKIEKNWKSHLRRRKLKRTPALAGRTGRARVRKGDPDAEPNENAGVELVRSEKARKFARLGGILRSRNMPKAAVIEYEKAHEIAKDDPLILGKLARTYLELSEYARAIALAEPLLEANVGDFDAPTTLGVAYQATGRSADAAHAFELALRVNPFDPAVRCGLAEAYRDTGRESLAKRERKACDRLTGK